MENIDLIKLVGQGGISVAALYVLARIVWKVTERMIEAIDRVGVKIDDHTAKDIAALTALSQSFVASSQLTGNAIQEMQLDIGTRIASVKTDVAVLSERVNTVIDLRSDTGEIDRVERERPPEPRRPRGGRG